MNPYETYLLYSALRLHFTSNYDYFRYKGAVRRTPENFKRLSENEIRLFTNVSRLSEPKLYLAGNFIFNSSNYIRDFNEQNYMIYRKFLSNGEYGFKQDLVKFKSPLVANFKWQPGEIPHIIRLLMNEEVSIFTACVFETLTKWTHNGDDQDNFLFEDHLKRVRKTHKFFKIDINKYKKAVIDHYKDLPKQN